MDIQTPLIPTSLLKIIPAAGQSVCHVAQKNHAVMAMDKERTTSIMEINEMDDNIGTIKMPRTSFRTTFLRELCCTMSKW